MLLSNEKKNRLRKLVFLETNRWCALIGALALAPSAVPGERASQRGRERLQMGTRMCGNVGAVNKEKTSFHVLNVRQTVFPIGITRTKFPGAENFYRKNGSWGTIFLLKISVRGTKIFRTKIPVTVPPPPMMNSNIIHFNVVIHVDAWQDDLMHTLNH